LRSRSLQLVLAGLFVLVSACAKPGARDEGDNKEAELPDVVVIGVDTLRAAYLSSYGFPHPSSPRIDQLASEGTLFTDAVSTSPWTLPSFASLLSGQYPSAHGAGLRTGPQRAGGEPPKSPLRVGAEVLPEILRSRAGFESAVFFDNPYLGEQWGLARGFDSVQRSYGGGEESIDRALRWIDRHRDRRTFVLLHLMEPHLPYEPPEPFKSRALEWISTGDSGDGPSKNRQRGAKVRALYAGEVAYTDHLVGTFVDGLAKRGVLDHTLLILMSDHGEEFYEHTDVEKRFYNDPREIWGIGHGHSQFQELLHIPLIIRYPGQVPAGRRIDSLVQLNDLAPSILEWLHLPIPQTMSGISLLPALRGESPREYAYSEFILYGDERLSYREGSWKLILGPELEEAELYDLDVDPGETVNLRQERPKIFQRLARGLQAVETRSRKLGQAQAGQTSPVTVDEETRRELRALGYIQ